MSAHINSMDEFEGWDPAPSATYVEGLREGVLRFLRCSTCGKAMFFPRVLCPSCGSTQLRWEISAGRGVVYSVTEIPQREGGSYNVSLVDVDEGFRLLTTVADASVAIGDRVEFAPPLSAGDEPRPVFVASTAGER